MRPLRFVAPVFLLGCMERADLRDPALRPFADMYAVDRNALGLTPVPRAGPVQIERRSGSDAEHAGYDVMLHLGGATSRTVAFERVGAGYRWLGEQELTYGPREYETADGRQREFIAITYYRRPALGTPPGLSVEYRGPDTLLGRRRPLRAADVGPTLARWRQAPRP